MFVSVALGVLAGAFGFAPLLLVWWQVRGGPALFRANATILGILGVGMSFVLLTGALLACFRLIPGSLLPFTVTLVATFFVGCLTIAIMELRH